MCLIGDGDERSTLLSSRQPRARKDHKCYECGRVIRAGERYTDERYLFDGRLYRHKTCRHCARVRRWLSTHCGGWIYGGVAEDIAEHAYAGINEVQVRIWIYGIHHKWTTASGRLWS